MDFFLPLLVAHLLADFCQPAALVRLSKRNLTGLLLHAGMYTLLSGIVLYGTENWWLWLSVLGISHLVLDNAKYSTARRVKSASLQFFLLDQLAHLVILLTVVWGLANVGATGSVFMAWIGPYAIWTGAVAALIGGTFGVSILIFEADRTLLPGPKDSVIGMADRAVGIIERAVATFLALTPFWWLLPLAFSYTAYSLVTRWDTPERNRCILESSISVVSTLAIAAALILY